MGNEQDLPDKLGALEESIMDELREFVEAAVPPGGNAHEQILEEHKYALVFIVRQIAEIRMQIADLNKGSRKLDRRTRGQIRFR
jgi:hypothetical protein